MEYHEMMVVLNGLAQNQQYVSETLDRFKEDVSYTLKRVVDENVAMKQELLY